MGAGIGKSRNVRGETENMCVWTKKRGSMNAVVLMATACPKQFDSARTNKPSADVLDDVRETLVCIKRPRCDTNGGRETVVMMFVRNPSKPRGR